MSNTVEITVESIGTVVVQNNESVVAQIETQTLVVELSPWSGGGGGGGPGPPGPPGRDGQIRFTGHGPPGVIVGAQPEDTYVDLLTGDIYKLT